MVGLKDLVCFPLVSDTAVALVLVTPLVQSEAMLDRHASTVPTFWVMGPVLAWAAWRSLMLPVRCCTPGMIAGC